MLPIPLGVAFLPGLLVTRAVEKGMKNRKVPEVFELVDIWNTHFFRSRNVRLTLRPELGDPNNGIYGASGGYQRPLSQPDFLDRGRLHSRRDEKRERKRARSREKEERKRARSRDRDMDKNGKYLLIVECI